MEFNELDSFDSFSNGSIGKIADKLQKLDINASKNQLLGLQSNFAQTIFNFQQNDSLGLEELDFGEPSNYVHDDDIYTSMISALTWGGA